MAAVSPTRMVARRDARFQLVRIAGGTKFPPAQNRNQQLIDLNRVEIRRLEKKVASKRARAKKGGK